MSKFWELFGKNVIITSSIALILLITACYLWATGQVLPDGLNYCLVLVLGYFFGAKTESILNARKVQ